MKLNPANTKGLERRPPRNYVENPVELAYMSLGLVPIVGEGEGFGVLERFGAFSHPDKGVHLSLMVQFDVPIENGTAEVVENGGYEGTSSEGTQVFPECLDKHAKDLVGEGRRRWRRLGPVATHWDETAAP